jgi:hypothetical protein
VSPNGLYRKAPFYPIFRHFKVCNIDLAGFETGNPTTLYRGHWQDQPREFRTGLPYGVERLEDLFVTSVPKYTCCTRFDGVFDQPWNMGEEFRPDQVRGSVSNGTAGTAHIAPLLPGMGR